MYRHELPSDNGDKRHCGIIARTATRDLGSALSAVHESFGQQDSARTGLIRRRQQAESNQIARKTTPPDNSRHPRQKEAKIR